MEKENQSACNCLCDLGFLRLPRVLELVPVCEASWWSGCKSGLYPKPYKIGDRSTGWKVKDIRECLESFKQMT